MTQQAITPELRCWILAQVQAGHSPESVQQAMKTAGWTDDVALLALETTLSDHLSAHGLAVPTLSPLADALNPEARGTHHAGTALAQASVVPEPLLAGSPRQIDAGDRLVNVLLSIAKPRVVVFGGLLSDDECDAIVAAAQPRLARSLTVEVNTGGEAVNADRTSDGMFFRRDETELISRIEHRIARLLNWPVENGEGMQVLHYQPGAQYKPHYDYFDPAQPGTAPILKRGGQRVGTLVMYLNNPAQGGGTTFPDVGLEVSPQKGNAVFFSYDRPHPTTQTLHGGAPVLAGDKWVATKWLREREFV